MKYFAIDRADYDEHSGARRAARAQTRLSRVRQAQRARLVDRNQQGEARRRSQGRARRRVPVRSQGADRGLVRRARVRMRGARQRSARGLDSRRSASSRAGTSSTATSRSTSIRKARRQKFPPSCRPPRRRSCARWRSRRSRRCRCAGWRASIFSRAAICARSTSTRSTPFPASPRSACIRSCGRRRACRCPSLSIGLIELALEEHRERASLKITLSSEVFCRAPARRAIHAMRRLLIATTNPAKLAEYRSDPASSASSWNWFRSPIVGISEAPEETGATFTENALIKARFYFASRRNCDAGRRRRTRDRRARRRARRPVASMARSAATIPTRRWSPK